MNNKLIYGKGINDADYRVLQSKTIIDEFGNKKRRIVFRCPFYSKWVDMLRRCCCEKYKIKYPNYKDVTVCEEWLTFSNFKGWMEQQDWEGKQLDKDVLIKGNKIYSPETCCFTSKEVNMFVIEQESSRGKLLLGVHLNRKLNKYVASVKVDNKNKYLGLFNTEQEAHMAWKEYKTLLAHKLAETEKDPRVAQALINRYS